MFSELNSVKSLSLSSQEKCSSPDHLHGFCLDLLQQVHALLVLRTPVLDAALQMQVGSHTEQLIMLMPIHNIDYFFGLWLVLRAKGFSSWAVI